MRFVMAILVLVLCVFPFSSYSQRSTESNKSKGPELTFKLKEPGIKKKRARDLVKMALIGGGGALLVVGTVVVVRALIGGEDLPGPPPPPE